MSNSKPVMAETINLHRRAEQTYAIWNWKLKNILIMKIIFSGAKM